MALDELLRQEMSRAQTDFVVNIVLQQPALFDELWGYYLHAEDPVNRRAAWAIDYITESKPKLLIPKLPQLIEALPSFKHNGLVRHALRMISRVQIPESHVGELVDFCFKILLMKEMDIAPKAFGMDILYRISNQEPDLKSELADTIAYRMDEGTPGYKAHANKLLQVLYREIDELKAKA